MHRCVTFTSSIDMKSRHLWLICGPLCATGMSGTMYRREDLAGMMDKLGDMGLGGIGEGMEDDGMPDDGGDDVDESAEEEKEEL